LPPGAYWLAYLPSSNSLGFKKGPISNGVPSSRYYSRAFGTLPTMFATTTDSTTSHWSLYATLSASNSMTIGETNVPAAEDDGNANLLVAQQATPPQAATVQSLSFYVTTAAGTLLLGIYDATGPAGGPGVLKAESASFVPVAGWNTANVLAPVSLSAGS